MLQCLLANVQRLHLDRRRRPVAEIRSNFAARHLNDSGCTRSFQSPFASFSGVATDGKMANSFRWSSIPWRRRKALQYQINPSPEVVLSRVPVSGVSKGRFRSTSRSPPPPPLARTRVTHHRRRRSPRKVLPGVDEKGGEKTGSPAQAVVGSSQTPLLRRPQALVSRPIAMSLWPDSVSALAARCC